MKRVFILLIALCLTSCSDNDSECLEIEKDYLEALGFTNGNAAAAQQVRSQYLEKKRAAGCD